MAKKIPAAKKAVKKTAAKKAVKKTAAKKAAKKTGFNTVSSLINSIDQQLEMSQTSEHGFMSKGFRSKHD